MRRHKKRYDFKKLLLSTGNLNKSEYYEVLKGDKELLSHSAELIAKEAVRQIKERELILTPCKIRTKLDVSTGKIRLIGKEGAMQQIFDYIAVRSCKEIWKCRIVPQQSSSIKGRGQVYGTSQISKWTGQDKRATNYAISHEIKYCPNCKHYVKLDIQKCYPSMRAEVFMRLFRRDCGNADILWLWETLLESHHVYYFNDDGECVLYEGFMIGALPSQMAAQYMLSFVYRYANDLHYSRRGKKIKNVSHMELFMDDMLLFGSSRSKLKQAVKKVIKYTKAELGLAIKPNWQILETDKSPVDMMGYLVHTDGNTTVRPRVFKHIRRALLRAARNGMSLRQAKRICSYKGYFEQPNAKYDIHLKSYWISKKLDAKCIFDKAASIVSTHERSTNHDSGIQCGTDGGSVYAIA